MFAQVPEMFGHSSNLMPDYNHTAGGDQYMDPRSAGYFYQPEEGGMLNNPISGLGHERRAPGEGTSGVDLTGTTIYCLVYW